MGAKEKLRILVVDDHFLVRMGLIGTLNMEPDLQVAGEADCGRQAVELYRTLHPDVVLMDLALPDINGIEATEAILKIHPKARVVLLSTYDGDDFIQRALNAGAASYLLKNMPREDLLNAIREVAAGRVPWIPPPIAAILARRPYGRELTSREREVLTLVVQGRSNKEIAAVLTIAEGTVKLHLNAILDKLGADNRSQASVLAIRRGLVDTRGK